MKNFSVNGVQRAVPVRQTESVQGLLRAIREQLISDSSCISSIRLDGQELTEDDEQTIGSLPVSELESVEVLTAHPRELADETLHNLIEFTESLELLSQHTAESFGAGKGAISFAQLIEGIDTFTEALTGVKQILRIGIHQELNVMEADLLSILRDLLEFYEKGDKLYVADLLKEHLPTNMRQWREETLPGLIRSRDS